MVEGKNYEYWDEKVQKVAKITKELGHEYLDMEFWSKQPAIIITIIVDLYDKLKQKDDT